MLSKINNKTLIEYWLKLAVGYAHVTVDVTEYCATNRGLKANEKNIHENCSKS